MYYTLRLNVVIKAKQIVIDSLWVGVALHFALKL